LNAGDDDMGDLNRLTLLAAVRGLEAIDGASSVTLLSNSRYLIRSLSDSLPRWRENDYAWEHFGQRIDIQHADLWRRVNRALAIHRVEAVLIASRLVSNGIQDRTTVDAKSGEETQLRIDSPHHGGPKGPRSARRSVPDQPVPEDQLRRWLLGARPAESTASAARRFTAQDLIETA
ncbi:MAG: ribonuclease HI, partial [Rubripirellula sp.]